MKTSADIAWEVLRNSPDQKNWEMGAHRMVVLLDEANVLRKPVDTRAIVDAVIAKHPTVGSMTGSLGAEIFKMLNEVAIEVKKGSGHL